MSRCSDLPISFAPFAVNSATAAFHGTSPRHSLPLAIANRTFYPAAMGKRGFTLVVSLMACLTALCQPSGKTVWEIDLHQFGNVHYTHARVWFWGNYIVVEPSPDFCSELNRQNYKRTYIGLTAFDEPLPPLPEHTVVLDLATRAPVSRDVLKDAAAARAANCPQVQGWWWGGQLRDDIPAAWGRSLLRRNGQGGLYLDRAGQPEAVFCSSCMEEKPIVRAAAPERVLLAAVTDYTVTEARIVDLQAREQFRLDLKGARNPYVVFNTTGTRFAVIWPYQSHLGHVRYWLDDFTSSGGGITFDRKTMKVFSAVDGEKLFEKTWHKDEADVDTVGDADQRVALSDDGSLLAYIGHGSKLVVWHLAPAKKGH
ncbi:MAG TPA: hypothetical protein VF532_24740 [Candidatus Angelobacter sp.]